ncbi:tumor necrosis factor receptor superfamily member 6-like [Clinocottus analis]|uniref:tumor necrosis factor receptor superfamily member 6-like n=1 Tax=Clinocottus analis TaxID=304258 RepID=UPI0035BF544A
MCTMQPLCCLVFTFLCGLSFLSPVLSLHCNTTQYGWPMEKQQFCCNMCPPGKRMARRSVTSCEIECELCIDNRYMDTYNNKMSCEICENCLKPNMEYRLHCNVTHNAVCKCKANYECKDQSCKQCVPIPSTTTKSTLPPSTTGVISIVWTPSQPIKDTIWFLVIIALLCAGIAIAVVTKIHPFILWIKSKHGYLLAQDSLPEPSGCEEVSTPVQEVLGKCEV